MATRNSIPIRLFIITPYPYVLWTLERLIESNRPKMETVGSASTCVEALREIDGAALDIIVFDADIGREECIASISTLKTSSGSKVLVLTGSRDESLHGDAVLAGASGVVSKKSPVEAIVTMIDEVHGGERCVDRATTSQVSAATYREKFAEARDLEQAKMRTLSARENDVLALATNYPSATAAMLAQMLDISEHTLRNHLSSIYEKLGVSGRRAMFAFAYMHGVTSVSPGHPDDITTSDGCSQ